MASPRRVRLTIIVEDAGGPEDWDRIMRGLVSIGAEIEDEEDIV